MVLTVTQEAYDETVRQNIEDFEMTVEEAVKETIDQFKAQGVDLSHIVTTWMLAGKAESPELKEAVELLQCLLQKTSSSDACIDQLDIITRECERGLNYQVFAGKLGAYQAILDTMHKFENDNVVARTSLRTLIALMTKQPDLLDELGIMTMIRNIDTKRDPEIITLTLKWTRECCVMHEKNRQRIFDADILEHLKPLLKNATSTTIKDVLAVLRGLVLDDDIRVDFGKSHEHARVIASDTLCEIMGLLEKFRSEESLMNDLLLTVAALLVRTEFCKKVEDAGGLTTIHDAMQQFAESEKVVKHSLRVLKALAGNDECKAHIISQGFAPLIITALEKHKGSLQCVTFGLACLSALTLRSPENSRVLFECGAADTIVELMRMYADNETVQKNGSWAIRNMVSRSRYQNEKFMKLGIEEILQADLKKFPKSEYDIKAALRDLGCKVQLKEEWTGKGGKIHTQSTKP